MKRSRKIFDRYVVYNAFTYYMQNSFANFSDVASFITKITAKKYTKDDIGRIFRHIVIFGESDDNARRLCHEVNWRSRYDKDFYNRFLGYRYELSELLKELGEVEEIINRKNQLRFLIAEYKNFASSEEEREGWQLESLSKQYDAASMDYNLLDMNYVNKLKENVKKIEKYRIPELLI